MIGPFERQDRVPPGRGTGQLERGLDRIGATRAAELDACMASELAGQASENFLDKCVLYGGHEVQGVHRHTGRHDLGDGFDDHRVVVPQRQGPGAGQAIDEHLPSAILHINAMGPFKHQGNTSRVTAGVGLLLLLTFQQRRRIEAVRTRQTGVQQA